MTAARRLRRTRAVLSIGVLLAAVGWAVAVAGGVLLLAGGADLVFGLTRMTRIVLALGSVILGTAAAAAVLWRNRESASLDGVALWLEERAPTLRYALVTLAEGHHPAVAPALEQMVAGVSWARPLRHSLLRSVAVPLVAGGLVMTALAALPPEVFERISSPEPGDILSQPVRRAGGEDALRPIVVTLVPPSYSRRPRQTLEDPEAIAGLAGTEVSILGRGDAADLSATLGGRPVHVGASGDRWVVAFALPDSAAALRLAVGSRERLLVIDARPDSVPGVDLSAPGRDTILSAPRGTLALHADLHDDYGLAEGWFEYVVSAGSGENFTFRTGVLGRHQFNGARDATMDASAVLDSLHLLPGDIVHLRAAARDRNIVTGPGIGFSDTRTIRVSRPGESDSVSVDAAAPAEADSSLLSERLLIMLAEVLQKRRPRLTGEIVIRESRGIARDQAALRRRVASVIFLRLGSEVSAEEVADTSSARELSPDDLMAAAERATESAGDTLDFAEDETPVVAVNRPLLEAYNAMWAAGRELEIGEPGRALPHMEQALAAIERARRAERIYLRGRPPAGVVDIARVRLAGKVADVHPGPARGQPAESGSIEALLERFNSAVEALPDPAALDSLAILRVDALRSAPEFAAALATAVAEIRSGRDATDALVLAHRSSVGPLPRYRRCRRGTCHERVRLRHRPVRVG